MQGRLNVDKLVEDKQHHKIVYLARKRHAQAP